MVKKSSRSRKHQPDEVLMEETTRVERHPVMIRGEPATFARLLGEKVVAEGAEPLKIKRKIIHKRKKVA